MSEYSSTLLCLHGEIVVSSSLVRYVERNGMGVVGQDEIVAVE